MYLLGIDFDYAVTETWHVNGYCRRVSQTYQQSRFAGYIMSFKDTNTGLRPGLHRQADGQAARWAARCPTSNDKNEYPQGLEANAPPESVALLAATGGLPDVLFRQTNLSLFGRYDIDKQSAVRVNLVYQYSKVNDWAWAYNGTPFAYSDGTTLDQQPTQTVGMIGVAYLYRF